MSDVVLDDASEHVDAKVRRHRRRVRLAGAVMVVVLATAITVGVVANRAPDKVGVVTTTPPKTAKLVPLRDLHRIDVVVTLAPTASIEDLWAAEMVLQESSVVAHYSRIARPLSQRTGDGYSCDNVPRWVVELEPGESSRALAFDRGATSIDAVAARQQWPSLFVSTSSERTANPVPALLPFATASSDTVEFFLQTGASPADVAALERALRRDRDVETLTRDPDEAADLADQVHAMKSRLQEIESELKLQIGPTLPPIVYTDASTPNLSIPPNATDDEALLLYERNALYNHIAETSAKYAELRVTGARPAPTDALLHRIRVTVAPAATASVAARYERMAGVAAVVTPPPVTCFTN